ncbi:phosphatases II [Hesseltinella vesiculosa]|uniref:Phosphatases II n=1 Tax=Hesseltinella vesiculosa TaxID=101127 RepID=A0A1X2GQW5_9FUNG|nr:phosphatases II [Hesseltinella vesiculosa]
MELDLSYITDQIIAMSYPGQGMEGLYRNQLDNVKSFLDKQHADHYKIFNLRSEKGYDGAKLATQTDYAFDDHQVPTMAIMLKFCCEASAWMKQDDSNVVVVHCKAGKGRTGLMVAILLLYCGLDATADDAIQRFGDQRTTDGKGVTVPSQLRYIHYFDRWMKHENTLDPRPVRLTQLVLSPIPTPYQPGKDRGFEFTIQDHANQVLYHQNHPGFKMTRSSDNLILDLGQMPLCREDLRIRFLHAPSLLTTSVLFSFWVNTSFILDESMVLSLQELDGAHKHRSLFAPDFSVTLHYIR